MYKSIAFNEIIWYISFLWELTRIQMNAEKLKYSNQKLDAKMRSKHMQLIHEFQFEV